MAEYEIRCDPAAIDLAAVHAFLSRESYWAQGISRKRLERAIAGSICILALREGALCGFARVVTDRATFAYLCDVFVLPEHRGRGLGKRLVEAALAHPELEVRRWMLATRDAQGLYAQFGFVTSTRAMELTSTYAALGDEPDER